MDERRHPVSLQPPWRIGIDVGGTFTDLVAVDASGAVFAHKTPTTASNAAVGVLNAIDEAAEMLSLGTAELLGECRHFIHGSTIATNVLLEDTGACVGLLTTDGFRDTLEVRRGYRTDPWDHRTPWRDAIVPRYRRLPIKERIDEDGAVVRPLDPDSVKTALETFERQGVDAVAICFLNSYANPEHEILCRQIVETERPGLHVTCSAELAPILGEYERTSTAVVNAYLAPKVVPYLEDLEQTLKARGLDQDLLLVQSNGGILSLRQLRRTPCTLALSGPAAGVGALRFIGNAGQTKNMISIEVGGTSCDVTLIKDGQVAELESLWLAERLIALPSVEIHTISAGGGTISGVDAAGMLFAGPRGAGAVPGPACYGLGGDNATVTDAQVALGRLRPGPYAGNAITLDKDKALAAIADNLADPLGTTVEDAAVGVIRLVEQKMRHAVEKLSFERGLDPREFTLVGAGGAGALHVVPVARQLGCRRAVAPKLAGVFCAFGMCNSSVRRDSMKSCNARMNDVSPRWVEEAFHEIESAEQATLGGEGFDKEHVRYERALDVRYTGQSSSLKVPVRQGLTGFAGLREAFERQYEQLYGHTQPDGQLEIVNVHLAAIGLFDVPEIQALPTTERPPVPHSTRPVYVDERHGVLKTNVFAGTDLQPGQQILGPAVIEETTTTVLIGPRDTLSIDEFGDYVINVGIY